LTLTIKKCINKEVVMEMLLTCFGMGICIWLLYDINRI
jgi:hypothetical protein